MLLYIPLQNVSINSLYFVTLLCSVAQDRLYAERPSSQLLMITDYLKCQCLKFVEHYCHAPYTPLYFEANIQCIFSFLYINVWGYWATSRKVAGSIPDGVIGFFH